MLRELGGYVAQYLGDGVMAYFGFPVAREDDARRAVLAGLQLVHAVSALSKRFEVMSSTELQVRVSVHTGSVVLSEMGMPERRDLLAVGDTPNLAARLQPLAEPDTVVVSKATHRLTHSFFRYRALGSSELRGFEQPIEAFQALAHTGNPARLSAASQLPPLVGREQDLAFLHQGWREATRGQDSVVTLAGEPGIGKSRIVRAFNLDVFFCTLTYSAWCHCTLGDPDRALAMSARTLALAERLEHPFSLALALDFRVQVMIDLGFDPEGTRALCARQLAIANENGFPLWVATGNARMGWLEARLGRASAGATAIKGALQLMRALGSLLVVPWGYIGLIESMLLDGRVDEALAVSDEAVEFCSGRLSGGAEPVLLGLRARALAACGRATAAEAQWHEALERLHARDAKWPELCVAIEYARFLRDTGRGAEARELLAPLYASITTKLDLPALQSARELLATH